MTTAANLQITGYRPRSDTATVDTAPTWIVAQNTNWAQNPGVNFRLRFLIQNTTTGTPTGNTVKIQVNRNGGAFQDVTTSSTIAKAVDAGASPDGTSIATARLGGTGTYVAGQYDETGATTTTVTIGASGNTEYEFGLVINAADVNRGDKLQFKVVQLTGSTITATTIPTVTVDGPVVGRFYDLPPQSASFYPGYPVQLRDWRQNLLLTTLKPLPDTTNMTLPFDWGVPDVVVWYQDWAQSLVLNLPVAEVFDFQLLPFDWGVPDTVEWRLSWSQSLALTLPSGQLPFNQDDWPNPVQVTYPTQLRSWRQNLLETTLRVVAAPFNQDDWPNPTPPIYPIQLRTWRQNLAETTLRPRPFNQYDWPTPSTPLRARDLRTWITQGQRLLIGQDKLPIRQMDWPVTPRAPEQRSWTQNLLQGTLNAPFAQRDWPNPISVTWYRTLEQNLLESTLAPTAANPFRQSDWPLPIAAQGAVDLRTWLATTVRYLGQDTIYAGPGQVPVYQWPNPQPVDWRRDWSLNLQLTTLARPFRQSDWPLPAGVTWYREWQINLQQTTLAPTVAAPFAQTDWPVPIRTVWYRELQQNLLQTTLFTPPAKPFAQTDWPLPTPVTWFRDWAKNALLFQPAPVPFNQYSWPLPQPVQWYREWAINPQLQLARPFAQYDWPLPGQVTWRLDWRNVLQQSTLAPPTQPVPVPFDWQVIRGPIIIVGQP
jgi:hypothetical protein